MRGRESPGKVNELINYKQNMKEKVFLSKTVSLSSVRVEELVEHWFWDK
jgi:hypothetical protein